MSPYYNSHNKANHDALPLKSGCRIGLAYDILLDTPTIKTTAKGEERSTNPQPPFKNVQDLVDACYATENDIFYEMSCWAEALEIKKQPSHPLVYVLDKTYPFSHLEEGMIDCLSPEDRARVLAIKNLQREVYGKGDGHGGVYALRAYLASIRGTVVKRGKEGELEMRFAVTKAVILSGVMLDHSVEERDIVDERSVVQKSAFVGEDGEEGIIVNGSESRIRTVSLADVSGVCLVIGDCADVFAVLDAFPGQEGG